MTRMILRRQLPTPTAEEMQQLLKGGQHERAAFMSAKATPRALAELLAALANFNGGAVALGVSSTGSVQRDNLAPALRDLLLHASLLTDPPLILPAAQEVETPHGLFLLVQVPPGLPNVYNVQGVYPTRAGSGNRPMTTAELRRLLLERGEGGFESNLAEGASVDDLEPQRVERYLDRLMLLPAEDATETLLARGCLRADESGAVRPTVAGVLLFGRSPQRFVRSAEILCVRYPGPSKGDEFVRQEIGGTLPEQIRQAEAFVSSNVRRETRIVGMAREESSEYPLAVVREAIVNAVAHRDYSVRGEGIRLLMFSDHLEVYSPGRLPGHVTLANLLDERYSRNEAIVAVLSDLGYIERLGYGVDRMFAAMREAGLPEPIFEETAAGFQVTLRAAAPAESLRLAAIQPAERRATAAHDPLNERQERALAFVQETGRITNSDLQEIFPDVSAETIRRDLADLVERTILLRIGSKRATYYILK